MNNIQYFFSDSFQKKNYITLSELWVLGEIMKTTLPEGVEFEDVFVLRTDDGTEYLNWNHNLKEIVSNKAENNLFF